MDDCFAGGTGGATPREANEQGIERGNLMSIVGICEEVVMLELQSQMAQELVSVRVVYLDHSRFRYCSRIVYAAHNLVIF